MKDKLWWIDHLRNLDAEPSILDSYTEAFIDVANKASETLIYDSSNYETFFEPGLDGQGMTSIGFGALTPKIASTSLTISKIT